jgi:nitrite reductase/ring-hydroxylating ferredoxin subunit
MSQPRWRQDFPILWEEDHYVTRRELAKFLTLGSGTIVAATVGVAVVGDKLRPHGAGERVRIEGAESVARGGSLLFRYPTDSDPCILVRFAEGKLAAYSQVCTHLSCAVVRKQGSPDLDCPCHEGHFDCADGRPTAGPPMRRLPRVLIEQTEEGVFAAGVEV